MATSKNNPEDYPDWTIWVADSGGQRMWHAGHIDNVGYFQLADENELFNAVNSYGKVAD